MRFIFPTTFKTNSFFNYVFHFSSTFGSGAARHDAHTSNGIDDITRAQALAEEEAAMNQYKVNFKYKIKKKIINRSIGLELIKKGILFYSKN